MVVNKEIHKEYVETPRSAWHILEKGIMTEPTYTISIKARHVVKVADRDVEVEVDCFGVAIRSGDEELIVDPRYNVAELRRRGNLVAVSDKVRYVWIHDKSRREIYEAREFAELVKNSVKELIEETVNATSFS
jgi:hypothetical protein